MNFARAILIFACTISATSLCIDKAMADAISPNIHETERVYSKEKPNAAYFGTGVAGRLTEASRLRFEGEHYTTDGQLDQAIKVLRKAVQLEPGYPEGHVLLARAMTKKIKRSEEPDKKLLAECMHEWNLINRHDADHTHQIEARRFIRHLKAIEKDIYEKEHPEKAKKRKSLFAKTSGWIKKKMKREEKEDPVQLTL